MAKWIGLQAYCQNGGICESQVVVNPENGTTREIAMCRCPDGYSGPRCQLFTDVCFPNPCLHGGLCQVISYSSSSTSTPVIEMSQNLTERSHRTAPAGAAAASASGKTVAVEAQPARKVIRGGPSYRCICPPDRVGRHCEVDRQTACLSDSDLLWCAHEAQCIAGPGGSKCNCPPGNQLI